MRRTPVTSSSIRSVGYDPRTRRLEIEFHHEQGRPRIYQYFDVPASAHRRLMAARSHGRHFNRFIKPRYRFVQVS
jgi:hypothetical protein